MFNREALREYASGSLWLLPSLSAVVALLVGWSVSQIEVGPNSAWGALAFQGTADDARALLTSVTGTVVTVIALVLGLTVVALQLSSTQFSPRLLRNFIRDRPNQVVLSIFVAAFVYAAAGLYTVGVASGARVETYPRLAVSGSLVLLFATLGAVVYFADHLAHSIQIDAITKRVEEHTLAVARSRLGTCEEPTPTRPAWATPLVATQSGYVQTVHPEHLLPVARTGATVLLVPRVGEFVVAGTALAWVWAHRSDDPPPEPGSVSRLLDRAIRIGFERTFEQDVAFGIRQLVDVACKALSPAVNDPYTAVQAIDHMSVIFCTLASRPLGDFRAENTAHAGRVIVPARRFGDYLSTMCGLIRRYGASEPTVCVALLRLLSRCGEIVQSDPIRRAAIAEQGRILLDNAAREIAQKEDLAPVNQAAIALQHTLDQPGGRESR